MYIFLRSQQKQQYSSCKQWRLWSDCAFAQSDQSLHCLLEQHADHHELIGQIEKIMSRLHKSIGLSESSLFAFDILSVLLCSAPAHFSQSFQISNHQVVKISFSNVIVCFLVWNYGLLWFVLNLGGGKSQFWCKTLIEKPQQKMALWYMQLMET